MASEWAWCGHSARRWPQPAGASPGRWPRRWPPAGWAPLRSILTLPTIVTSPACSSWSISAIVASTCSVPNRQARVLGPPQNIVDEVAVGRLGIGEVRVFALLGEGIGVQPVQQLHIQPDGAEAELGRVHMQVCQPPG